MIDTQVAPKPPKSPKRYTVQAYLAREDKALDKHEYYNGKIIKMAGGKLKHNIISANNLHQSSHETT